LVTWFPSSSPFPGNGLWHLAPWVLEFQECVASSSAYHPGSRSMSSLESPQNQFGLNSLSLGQCLHFSSLCLQLLQSQAASASPPPAALVSSCSGFSSCSFSRCSGCSSCSFSSCSSLQLLRLLQLFHLQLLQPLAAPAAPAAPSPAAPASR